MSHFVFCCVSCGNPSDIFLFGRLCGTCYLVSCFRRFAQPECIGPSEIHAIRDIARERVAWEQEKS